MEAINAPGPPGCMHHASHASTAFSYITATAGLSPPPVPPFDDVLCSGSPDNSEVSLSLVPPGALVFGNTAPLAQQSTYNAFPPVPHLGELGALRSVLQTSEDASGQGVGFTRGVNADVDPGTPWGVKLLAGHDQHAGLSLSSDKLSSASDNTAPPTSFSPNSPASVRSYCDTELLPNEATLWCHSATVTPPIKRSASPSTGGNIPRKRCRCDLCSKDFGRRAELNRHKKEANTTWKTCGYCHMFRWPEGRRHKYVDHIREAHPVIAPERWTTSLLT
ncbi:hypothetical protein BC834DRAFT_425311 [Gloeopeniophorella convolvens]|nr:hypothetical protein BC834DRAFT_425311 [Gloeopeniophorella convolvens]